MGKFVVWIVYLDPGEGVDGVEQWVRSKPSRESYNQKFDADPIKDLR